jgi:RND family efflux transporter MFP subunit
MKTAIFAVGLSMLAVLSACSRPEPLPEPIRNLRVMEVGEVASLQGGQVPGRARSADEVDLAFDVSGTLIERPVNVGTTVKQGDLIARLDPRDFQANVRAAEADARNAERNFKRGQELLADKFISEMEYDRLEARVDVTQSALQVAQKALSDSEIYAPFSGIIANTFVENFQSVPAKKVIARLLGVDVIEMVINVSEHHIANLRYISGIEVEYDALPGTRFDATIVEVGTEASTTTRTFPITLSMKQNPERPVLAGMAGIAYISIEMPDTDKTSYVIPPSALFGDAQSNESMVWVVGSDNQVSSRKVKVGRISRSGIEILDGLQAGDMIATAGAHVLAEGQQVNPVKVGG